MEWPDFGRVGLQDAGKFWKGGVEAPHSKERRRWLALALRGMERGCSG